IAADVPLLGWIERHDTFLAPQAIAEHRQESERILLQQRLHLRRGDGQELASVRDLAFEARIGESLECRRRAVSAEEKELAIGQITPVLAGLEELRVDRFDLRRAPQP